MKRQIWASLVGFTVGTCAVSVAAIPPPPPAQAGSRVGTYNCGRQSLTVSESWNYKVGRRDHYYVVRIGGKPLSQADARRLDREIKLRGPFQAVSVYCLDGVPYEVALHRYTPSEERLGVYFQGRAIRGVR